MTISLLGTLSLAACQNESAPLNEEKTSVFPQPRAFEVPDDAIEVTVSSDGTLTLEADQVYVTREDMTIEKFDVSGNVTLFIAAYATVGTGDVFGMPTGLTVVVADGGTFYSPAYLNMANEAFIVAEGGTFTNPRVSFFYYDTNAYILNYGTFSTRELYMNRSSFYNLTPGILTVCDTFVEPESPGDFVNTGTFIQDC